MLYLKTCPKCHGDVHLEKDIYGLYLECLQCGYMVDADEDKVRIFAQAAASKKAA